MAATFVNDGTTTDPTAPAPVPVLTATTDDGTRVDARHGLLTGPWVSAFWVEVPMPLRSKSNFRRGVRTRAQRGEWGRLKAFEHQLATLVEAACPDAWPLGERDKPLLRRPQVISFIWARTTLDTANLSKSVLDACQDLIFHNDASVRWTSAHATRTGKDKRGLLAFAVIDADADLTALHLAANSLVDAVVPFVAALDADGPLPAPEQELDDTTTPGTVDAQEAPHE
jgi:Holliday junction resolvase RusA-like endonuclease